MSWVSPLDAFLRSRTAGGDRRGQGGSEWMWISTNQTNLRFADGHTEEIVIQDARIAMAQEKRSQALAEDDVRIVKHRTLDSDVGHGWDVSFGRSSTPMHSIREETARRAAQQHARGHQVAVWLIIKDHPESRQLLYDHRKADKQKGGK